MENTYTFENVDGEIEQVELKVGLVGWCQGAVNDVIQIVGENETHFFVAFGKLEHPQLGVGKSELEKLFIDNEVEIW